MTDFDVLSDLLGRRHSCRAFLADEIPQDTVARIVETAQRVPSWCNAQPWQLSITRGAATERLADTLLDALKTAPAQPDFPFPIRYDGPYRERRRACGFQLYDALGIARDDKPARAAQMAENFRFFGAPHTAVVTTEADLGPYGAVDCGAFVTAFMLAAEALGIASIAQAAIAAYAPQVRAALGIPDTRYVVCAISFGKPDTQHPANLFRTEREDPDQVIDWVES